VTKVANTPSLPHPLALPPSKSPSPSTTHHPPFHHSPSPLPPLTTSLPPLTTSLSTTHTSLSFSRPLPRKSGWPTRATRAP
jgi:hypothetical protein